MSHEITNLDLVGIRNENGQQDRGWHGLGTPIEPGLAAVAAAEKHGLLWPVAPRPIYWQDEDGSFHKIDSHVANIRTRDTQGVSIRHLLGVVGADYQICQNRELAEFTDALAQTGKVEIETIGSIRGGKRVWFLARGEAFDVGDRDKVYPYVLVSNAHDSTQAIRVTPTTVRVVCSNTLHMVIPREGERPETAAICIRHQGRIADKLEQAKAALRYYSETLRRNQELFEALQEKRMDRQAAMGLFAQTYATYWRSATDEELSNVDKKIRKTAENRLKRMQKASKAFMDRYIREQEALELGDTAWAAFNSVSGFLQHEKARGKDDQTRVARRIESNLFGLNASRTYEVLSAVLAS